MSQARRLEGVLEAHLAADGRGSVFTRAKQHVDVKEHVVLAPVQTEVGLDGGGVDHVLAVVEELDILVAEGRHIGDLEARGDRPAACVKFACVDV